MREAIRKQRAIPNKMIAALQARTYFRTVATADADKRREIMAKLEAIMLEEGVVTQPYWRSLYNHNRPHVKGMGMHPTFEIHMDKIWLDA